MFFVFFVVIFFSLLHIMSYICGQHLAAHTYASVYLAQQCLVGYTLGGSGPEICISGYMAFFVRHLFC